MAEDLPLGKKDTAVVEESAEEDISYIIEDTEDEEEPEEIEPIDISSSQVDSDSSSFQVGTLAELAQMDNEGTPRQPDAYEGAIELEAKKIQESARVSSIEGAIQTKVKEASSTVASKLEGVSTAQVQVIEKLTSEVIERIVWEIVPDLAEVIIKEELEKLLKE